MSPDPSIQPLVLLSHASFGDCVMKKTSPCHAPVVGLAMWPVPLLLITSMSPSLVVLRAFPSHSLVPSGLRKTLMVLSAPPLIFTEVWPSRSEERRVGKEG